MRRLSLVVVLLLAGAASAQELTGLRGPSPLTEEPEPAPIPKPVNDDIRQARNYPEQPPVIPHVIDSYQITKNANKCLSCHSRQFTTASQAPMVSITHYMDRDGQVLAAVSPRRSLRRSSRRRSRTRRRCRSASRPASS